MRLVVPLWMEVAFIPEIIEETKKAILNNQIVRHKLHGYKILLSLYTVVC